MQLNDILICPKCQNPLKRGEGTILGCGCSTYLIREGIIDLISNETEQSGQSPSVDISCLILTLNEAESIALLVKEVREELTKSGLSFEVLVIDGGSSDGTSKRAREAGATVLQQSSPGYAEGFIQGLRACNGEYILTLDGDLSHPTELIPALLEKRSDYDILVGSRWIRGGAFKGPIHRQILSRFLNLVFRRALSLPVIDSSSGYRLYRRSILSPSEYKSKDFSILEEVLVRAVSQAFSVYETPLNYQPRRVGTSHARLFSFALSYLKTLARLWLLRNDSGAADYDHRAYDSPNLIQRWWQRMRHRNISSLLGHFKDEGAVLDVGCGSSRIIQSLPHAVALDLSLEKLRFLKPSNPHRIRASASSLPFKDQSFDCLIHSQLIEHLPHSEKTFSEMRRILKPGGILIIGTVDYSSFWWPIIEEIYGYIMPHAYKDEHITQYSESSLRETLVLHGFSPEEIRRIPGGEFTIRALRG